MQTTSRTLHPQALTLLHSRCHSSFTERTDPCHTFTSERDTNRLSRVAIIGIIAAGIAFSETSTRSLRQITYTSRRKKKKGAHARRYGAARISMTGANTTHEHVRYRC